MMGILKTRPLTELLSQSISHNVTYALLMTDSGALLATGTPKNTADAKRARTHAALAASIWCSYDHIAAQGSIEQSLPDAASRLIASTASGSPTVETTENTPPGLKSLTLELSDHNMHIQVVATHVLLCLIGPKYPTANTSSNSSLHSAEVPNATSGSPSGSIPKSSGSAGSAAHTGGTRTPVGESVRGTVTPAGIAGIGGSLGILKTQAQGLVSYLEKELQGFELREGL